MIGIYNITCETTGTSYIGSTTVSFEKRWRKHRQRLTHNCHENSYLQNAWNKYGENDFLFEIVEVIENKLDVLPTEKLYLSGYFASGREICFNLSDHSCGGNTIKDAEVQKRHSDAVKESYTNELRYIRRQDCFKRIDSITATLAEVVKTEKWKMAVIKANRKTAKDPEWLLKMKEVNERRGISVHTDRGETFCSVADAAKVTGACRANIRACINGKIKTCVGRKWFYS